MAEGVSGRQRASKVADGVSGRQTASVGGRGRQWAAEGVSGRQSASVGGRGRQRAAEGVSGRERAPRQQSTNDVSAARALIISKSITAPALNEWQIFILELLISVIRRVDCVNNIILKIT